MTDPYLSAASAAPGAPAAPAGEAAAVEAELREKGSRFRAFALPAADEEAARAALAGLRRRFPDASHHCWAWRLGAPPREGSSDAGEPRGTAGMPILQALRGAAVSDALVVVVRWFGGTKLGKGGLARAYAAVAREALRRLPAGVRMPVVRVAFAAPCARVGAVKRLIHPPEVELEREDWEDGTTVRLVLRVQAARQPALEQALAELEILVPRAPLV